MNKNLGRARPGGESGVVESSGPKARKKTVAAPEEPLASTVIEKVRGRAGISLVQQVVEALRAAILQAGPGRLVGSEEQLVAALGVSRPTFRQAAKLLRQDCLIDIRRGLGGGFFTRVPTVDGVRSAAATFLATRGTTARQLIDVIAPLQTQAAVHAACLPDAALRGQLRAHEQAHARSPWHPARRLLAFEIKLSELCGNPALGLVLQVSSELAMDERYAALEFTPERVADVDRFRTALADAVADGEAAGARQISDAFAQTFRSWLPESRLAPEG